MRLRHLVFRRSAWLFLSVFSTFACKSTSDSSSAKVIPIGILVEFDDPSDSEEEFAKANLVAREINEAGGLMIGGESYAIQIVAEDHQGNVAGAVAGLDALLAQGITSVLGPPWSSLTLGSKSDYSDGAAAFAARNNMLLMSGSATNPAISTLDDDDLMWRTAPSDALQAVIAADHLYGELGVRRAAILHRNEVWGQGLSDAFTESFEALGGQVIASVGYDVSGDAVPDIESYSYHKELDEVFAEMPDVVLLLSFDEVFQITNRIVVEDHLGPYGDSPPFFFGADAVFTKELLDNAPPEILRRLSGASGAADVKSPNFQKLLSNFQDNELGSADNFDAARYDGIYCMAYAMQSAQSTDPAVYKSHLRPISNALSGDITVGVDQWAQGREALLDGKTINYEGASGAIAFDEYGDPGAGYFVLWEVSEVSPGNFEYNLENGVRFPEK